MVELLIESGAKVNARDGKKRTALDIARSRDDQRMVELLKSHKAR